MSSKDWFYEVLGVVVMMLSELGKLERNCFDTSERGEIEGISKTTDFYECLQNIGS